MNEQTPIAPTERFMPPVASTTIWAKPTTTSTATERPIELRLKVERKPGDRLSKNPPSTDRMIQRPNWVEPRVSSPVIDMDAPELDGTCAVIDLLATDVICPGAVVGARQTGGTVDRSRPLRLFAGEVGILEACLHGLCQGLQVFGVGTDVSG